MEHSPEPTPRLPDNAEAAFEQQYSELSRVMSNVFNKVIGRHASASEKTWADVGDLQHVTQVMRELDQFLGPNVR
jgi:hypothetical protein